MSIELSSRYPRLLADIGGTNARFALETAPGQWEQVTTVSCRDFPSLELAIRAYYAKAGVAHVAYAAIGIANPVVGDWVQMTNHHWAFSIEATRLALGLERLIVINDFTALALALPHLPERELIKVGGAEPWVGSPLALLGPGTGLGMSGLVPTGNGNGNGYVPLSGEGGHASFAPFDEREMAIWRYACTKYSHVSTERLLSGPGLELIYEALQYQAGETGDSLSAADITDRGLSGDCPRCRETLDVFCAILGTAASNLALMLGARGGVYIGGGIVPRLGDYFAHSPFRTRFEDKGRFSGYLAGIPVYVITTAYPAMYGVSAALNVALS
ncbi:glucokinase [Crenobacter sp. SG2305]|uniref:glucokinase n=1 Tax=Crenobacter oryzisoli TaxID=3056844 RepID=UPI0025AB3064|nr:glucokinase [Crenobacter sp. SG2305]MDN0085674.1 glucokinase [Crenobacter sp. SG2305]